MTATLSREPSRALPEPVAELTAQLEAMGHATYWVGEGLTETLLGRSPSSWSFVTRAQPANLIAALPTAIPTRPKGRAFVIPSKAGPVDMAPLPPETPVDDHLKGRGFSVISMAWRHGSQEWHDPTGGLKDLEDRQLRSAQKAEEDFRQSPHRILQAARLTASLHLDVDPAIESAMKAVFATRCRNVPACDLRQELHRLLLTDDPTRGIELLHRTSVDTVLGLAHREDHARLMAEAPRDLGLRWFIWLREARGARALRRLRIDPDLATRVRRLLAVYPLEKKIPRRKGRALRKAFERIGQSDFEKLMEIRHRELEGIEGDAANHSRDELQALFWAFAAELEEVAQEASKITPVLGGTEVMRLLDLPPGPQVGAALSFLEKSVNADPECNTQDALEALLRQWASRELGD